MVEIRKSLPKDLEEIARIGSLTTEILRRTYRPVNLAGSGLEKSIEKLESLVAIDNARVVGVVEYRIEDNCICFQGLAVDPVFH